VPIFKGISQTGGGGSPADEPKTLREKTLGGGFLSKGEVRGGEGSSLILLCENKREGGNGTKGLGGAFLGLGGGKLKKKPAGKMG